jgi:hypothetical protein
LEGAGIATIEEKRFVVAMNLSCLVAELLGAGLEETDAKRIVSEAFIHGARMADETWVRQLAARE